MEGQCQCGAVRFTTPTDKPVKIFICHCIECRRQSASAFGITFLFPYWDVQAQNPTTAASSANYDPAQQGAEQSPNDAENGSSIIGVYTHSNCTSGKPKSCYFCKKCGTRILHHTEGGKMVSVKAGCLDGLDEERLKDAIHIWTKRAVVPIPDGVQRFEGEPSR